MQRYWCCRTLAGPCLGLTTRQQIECCDVRDHQQRHIDDRDRVRGAQFPCQRRKAELAAVIIVDDDVGCSCEIEGYDEDPKTERICTVRSASIASNPVVKSP